jgi:hypothetical protein
MTHEQREQAAEVLEKFQKGIYGYGGKVGVAIDTAIAALRGPVQEPITGYSHTHRLYSQSPEAICPKCGKPMDESGFFPAGVIECNLYRWKCIDCDIRREQAHDWPNFQPREWHRPLYSVKGGEWIGEDETEKLKAALDTLPPLPKVDTPFGFERIGGDWEETAE